MDRVFGTVETEREKLDCIKDGKNFHSKQTTVQYYSSASPRNVSSPSEESFHYFRHCPRARAHHEPQTLTKLRDTLSHVGFRGGSEKTQATEWYQ